MLTDYQERAAMLAVLFGVMFILASDTLWLKVPLMVLCLLFAFVAIQNDHGE